MIIMMLQSDPKRRPNVSQLLTHEFMLSGVIPQSLPASCLTMEPRADQWNRKPLAEIAVGKYWFLVQVTYYTGCPEIDQKAKRSGVCSIVLSKNLDTKKFYIAF